MDVQRELYASLVLENLWKEAVSSLFKITKESCDSYWINMSNILKCFCYEMVKHCYQLYFIAALDLKLK